MTYRVNVTTDLSTGASAGQVPTADGTGGVAWQTPTATAGSSFAHTDLPATPYVGIVSADGYATNYTNSLQCRYDAIASVNLAGQEYQAIVFWDKNGYLTIGTRKITGAWTLYTFSTIAVSSSDAHKGAAIGIDPDGYIHVSYDNFQSALKYRRSNVPISTWTGTLTDALSMTGSNENQVTYPTFFNDANGNLYFMFLNGSSTSDLFFYTYSPGAATWTAAAGTSTGGVLLNGGTDIYPYHFQPWFDESGNLHFFFMWTTTALNTRYRVCYVKWDGESFTQAGGAAQTVPITPDNAGIVDDVAQTGIGQHTGAMADALGRPHVVYSYYPALPGRQSVRHAYYDGTEWVIYTWTNQTADSTTIGIYPRIVIDEQNIARILYVNPDNTAAGILTLTSGANDYTTWRAGVLYAGEDAGIYMPKFDAYQWRKHRILYLSFEPYFSAQSALNIKVIEYAPTEWAAFDAAARADLHANDTDTATGIHHTIGTGANQAAAGNHTHAGSVTTLDSLTDVTITTPANGQQLQYNGSAWVNADPPTTGKYRQFLYTVIAGSPTFLTDNDGNILTVALDME